MELDEMQVCLGCRKTISLLVDGYRCLDCPFFFCRPCAEYHFGKSSVSPTTGKLDRACIEQAILAWPFMTGDQDSAFELFKSNLNSSRQDQSK